MAFIHKDLIICMEFIKFIISTTINKFTTTIVMASYCYFLLIIIINYLIKNAIKIHLLLFLLLHLEYQELRVM